MATTEYARADNISAALSLSHSEIARLAEKTTVEEFHDTIDRLQHDALAQLDQKPRESFDLARLAHELAHAWADDLAQAKTALTFAIVLNRLGEFCDALGLSNSAAAEFSKQSDLEQAARGCFEAAWAQTFLGHLRGAMENAERAREFDASMFCKAESDWIEGRVLRVRGEYIRSQACFRNAREIFESARMPLHAARCQRELADTMHGDHAQAVSLLQSARDTFKAAGCPLDVGLCDWIESGYLLEVHQYPDAIESLRRAQHVFSETEAVFFAAWCDGNFGIIYRHLNRYEESLEAGQRARNYFLSHGVPVEVSACDINLGNTHYVRNEYDDALRFYQEAADLTVEDYRPIRAALIYDNMGLIYEKQGYFAKSIELHERALWISEEKGLEGMVANALANLASACRQLGQYDKAIDYFCRARSIYDHRHLPIYVAECDLGLAKVYSVRGQITQAIAHLQQARDVYAENGLESFVAVCDRLHARLTGESGDRVRALTLVEESRTIFQKHRQMIDAALCDLTEGELYLQWNDFVQAKDAFQRARTILSLGISDQIWRVEYGLGRCAWSAGDYAKALNCYLRAARTITQSRSALVTEQLSNDYFASRQSLFETAMKAAIELNAIDSALEIIESVKARIMLTLVQRPEWQLRKDSDDAYIRDLIKQEKELRYRLDALRACTAVHTSKEISEILRSGTDENQSASALYELKTVSQAYELVVNRLRLASSGLAGVSSPEPFALDEFRQSANSALGTNWAALDYHLSGGNLTIALVKPDGLEVIQKNLSAHDQKVLLECTATDQTSRLRIYRSMRQGESDLPSNADYLSHLYRLLIPAGLDVETLIIVPHGRLHALPFHALVCEDGYMIERHRLFYAPSLQVLQRLLVEPTSNLFSKSLAVGLSNFEGGMPSLPWTSSEIEKLLAILDGEVQVLWGDRATRKKLLELNASGELQKFNLLHFATHSVVDPLAPHRSSVRLHDRPLTTLDILDMRLDARLVTLSACESSLGQRGSGDELIGLAHAFFYAGARALLATLWNVEDISIVKLTSYFYSYLADGENAAAALRHAQVDMIREGYSPYQWAPFVLIGRPL